MSGSRAIEELRAKFGDKTIEYMRVRGNIHMFEVRKKDLPDILDHAYNKLGGHFMTMAGTDTRDLSNCFVLDYVLGWREKGILAVFRTKIPRGDEDFPSATPYVPCADWYEREVKDFLGLTPVGHPRPLKLLLPDDWPEQSYPLRRDYRYDQRPPSTEKEGYPFKVPEKRVSIIPYGPYHFAMEEPMHFRIFVDGERIVDADFRGGFNYRGVEKIAEAKLNYGKIPFIAERICGICGFTHSECFVQALEKAAEANIPDRAKWIRTILLEIERIHSHLLWLGVASHLVGFDSGFMQFWRVREKIMLLAELLTGNRKTYGMIALGGVRRDVSERKRKESLRLISEVTKGYKELLEAALNLGTFIRRLKGVGYLSKEDARKYSVVGPVARGCGISMDARKDYPYEAYEHFNFRVPVMSEGDVFARTVVRAEEVLEALSIIEQALNSMPNGPVHAYIDYIPPEKISIGLTEAPRGTNVHFLMTGKENTVYRWRVRAPTYANLQVAHTMLRGHTLADAPIIIGSVDPCISCMERFTVVDTNSGKEATVLSEALLNKAAGK